MNVATLSGMSRLAGGLFYAVRSLNRTLAASGVDLTVYGRNDPFVNEDAPTWAPVRTAPYKAFGPLGTSGTLRRLLADARPDLVHLHGLWMDDQWTSLQWQRKTERPVVVSPHGMLDPWALKNSAWKKQLVGALFANRSLRSATCIHALCQSEADSIRAYGLDNPIAMIPNAVELPELMERRPNDEKKRLLFLGRIHPKKGLSELIDGWAKAALKDWELLIAGWDDGGHLAGLEAQAEARCCEDSIAFAGPLFGAAKEVQLRGVDAFILPSYSEGLPMSVLEAWSYGLPVVMTEFCNLPAGFESGAALQIEPDSASVAEGLRQLDSMSDDELSDMGMKGRKLVEQSFTWEKVAGDMRAVYEWCLGGDRPTCIQEGAGVRWPC